MNYATLLGRVPTRKLLKAYHQLSLALIVNKREAMDTEVTLVCGDGRRVKAPVNWISYTRNCVRTVLLDRGVFPELQ